MNTFSVNIYTPEALVVSEEAVYLSVPGADGSYGIMYNHLPCVIALAAGEHVLSLNDEHAAFLCGEGFLEVRDNQVNIFVNSCEEVK